MLPLLDLLVRRVYMGHYRDWRESAETYLAKHCWIRL